MASLPPSHLEDSLAISRRSISDQVFDRLRKDIFSGRFKPGEPLKELALAEAFGVSQSSVRAALQQLSHQGLVVRSAHRGSHITEFTPEELVERTRVRIVLESFAAQEARRRLDSAVLAMLREKAATVDDAVKAKKDRVEISARDLEFHKTLWQASGNQTLQQTLESLCAPLFAFLLLKLLPYGEQHIERIKPHLTIVDALAHGAREQIEDAIRTHIVSSWYPFLGDSIDWGS